MIQNPKTIAESGIIKNLEGGNFECQQNGIDLTLESVSRIEGGKLLREHRDFIHTPIVPDASEVWMLHPGAYSIEFQQEVEVPENMCAQIIQRSTLNRMGGFVLAGLYDSGFKNQIGAVLRVSAPIQLQKGARVAQIIFQEADAASQYSGVYQGK